MRLLLGPGIKVPAFQIRRLPTYEKCTSTEKQTGNLRNLKRAGTLMINRSRSVAAFQIRRLLTMESVKILKIKQRTTKRTSLQKSRDSNAVD